MAYISASTISHDPGRAPPHIPRPIRSWICALVSCVSSSPSFGCTPSHPPNDASLPFRVSFSEASVAAAAVKWCHLCRRHARSLALHVVLVPRSRMIRHSLSSITISFSPSRSRSRSCGALRMAPSASSLLRYSRRTGSRAISFLPISSYPSLPPPFVHISCTAPPISSSIATLSSTACGAPRLHSPPPTRSSISCPCPSVSGSSLPHHASPPIVASPSAATLHSSPPPSRAIVFFVFSFCCASLSAASLSVLGSLPRYNVLKGSAELCLSRSVSLRVLSLMLSWRCPASSLWEATSTCRFIVDHILVSVSSFGLCAPAVSAQVSIAVSIARIPASPLVAARSMRSRVLNGINFVSCASLSASSFAPPIAAMVRWRSHVRFVAPFHLIRYSHRSVASSPVSPVRRAPSIRSYVHLSSPFTCPFRTPLCSVDASAAIRMAIL